MPNTAGNSLATSTPLKLLSSAQSFQDLVTPTANDYYHFSLTTQSSFNLSLTGLDANANVALLDSTGSLVTIDGVELRSTNQGRFAESINTVLDPGVYYIQVAPGINTPTANYTLTLSGSSKLESADLIWRNILSGEDVFWGLNAAYQLATYDSLLTITPLDWRIASTGDFNYDGQSDILWRYESLGLTVVWLMEGVNLIGYAELPQTKGIGWAVGGIADFNDDGQNDILWYNSALGQLDVWAMQGVNFVSSIPIAATQGAPTWSIGGVGDFNSDGNVDILWRDNVTLLNEVWLLSGTSLISKAPIGLNLPANWYITGVADFDGDAKPDILWRDYSATGRNQIWLLDGLTLSSSIELLPVTAGGWISSPYSLYETPDLLDIAGNTIATAFNLGTGLGQSATYRDRVSSVDANDYYRFDITNTTQVSLLLSNLTGNLDLQLFDSSGNTILGSSAQSGLSPESIIRSLSAGTYYARVFPALGQAASSYTLSVNITSPPVLVSNNPLILDEQGSATIRNSLLRVTDNDTPDSQLVYTVGNATTNGSLLINGVTATAGTTFTQVNLDDPSQVRYVHNGSETTSDRFSFTVSDGTGGSVGNQTFSIQVNPVNDAPILISNNSVTLSEGDGAILTPVMLLISDVDSPAVSLQYSISSVPTNGTLLLAGTATNTFTQNDIFNGLVRYQHNGSEAPFDRFTFTVTDGAILLPGSNTFNISVLPVNDAPGVAINTALTLSEGTGAAITPILLLATDADGPAPVAYTLGSSPTNGVLKLGTATLQTGQTFTQLDIANGQLTYIHNGGETTSDRFQFTVTDGLGATSAATTFSISVLAINDAPVLTVPSNLLVDQNTNTLISGIRLTDVDLGDNDVTVSLSASSGVLTLGRTTGVTFLTGDGTQDASLSFRGRQDVANFVLESLIYRSTGAFEGTDVVNIAVNDGGNFGLGGVKADSKAITLTVAGVNDAPVLTAPVLQTLNEDVSSPINGISIVDSDAGVNPLTVSLSVANGSLTLSSTSGLTFATGTGTLNKNLVFSGSQGAINAALAGLTYLSDRNYNGSDLLTMNVSDNGFTGNGIPLSASKLINLTINPVNDAPVITVPSNQSATEGTDLRISGISINDVDVNNGNLTVAISAVSGLLSLDSLNGLSFTTGDGTQDSTLIFQGTQSAVNAALSALTYRANANFGGVDTIAVSVTDGGNSGTGIPLSDSKSIAVNVLGINNPPVIALPTGTLAVDSGINLTIAGFSVNDPDVGSGTLSVTVLAENGVLSLRSLSGLQFTQGTGTQNNRITFTGSIAAINDALSQVTYRSYAGFTNAFDRITLSVNDNGNTGVGVPLSDTKTLLVNVGNAVNLSPVATADSFTVAERGTLLGTSVLANDTDPDFTLPLTAQLVSPPPNGSFSFSPNGTFTYTPTANFNGFDTFSYVARDVLGGTSNTAIVVINVTSVNDLPVATNDAFTTPEDQPLTGNVLANDTDADNPLASLNAQVIAAPSNALSFGLNPDGSFSYTPRLNFNGIDRFTYVAIDPLGGTSNTAIVSLTITAANDAPIATNDGIYAASAGGTLSVSPTNGILRNDTDVEGSPLTATLVGAPTNGTVSLSADGSFIYRPTGNFAGTDVFTYRASDGSVASNLATVTLSVGANNAPIALPNSYTTAEDTLLTTGNVLTNDTDVDGNTPLTASIIAAPANALAFSLNADGSFTYQPKLNFNGTDTFVYTATDSLGAVSNPTTVTFNVTPVNDAPVAVNDTYSVNTTALSITSLGILANDTDVDSPSLTAILASGVQHGSLSLNSNGSFTYQPTAGYLGADSFTYRANDGSLDSTNIATVNLFVTTATTTVNVAPIATADLFITAEDTLINTGNVLINDTDTDGNTPLTASVIAAPTNALSFTLRPDGSFSYQPNLNITGLDTFTYAAIDSLGAVSSLAIATFSITPVNDAPLANNDVYNVTPNGSLNVTALGVLANDTDVEGSPLTASLVTAPSSGTFNLNPDGSFNYAPQTGFSGNVSFTYRASDGLSTSGLATVSLSISPNTAPIVQNDNYLVASGIAYNQSLILQGVLANDSDAENNPLTASVVSTPTNGVLTLNPNGTFIYTSNTGYQGTDIFTYRAFDGLASSTATVSISVRLNTPPLALPDTYTAIAGQPLNVTAPGLLLNDLDAEDPISVQSVSQPTQGTLSFNPDGSFVYQPNPGVTAGTDFFTYRATDGFFDTVPITVTINISPLTAVNDTYSVNRDNLIIVPRTLGVLANDLAPNSTVAVVSNPTQGSVNLSSDGSFVYTPNLGVTGTDTFTYRATSGSNSSTAIVTISVKSTSAPPTVQNDSGYLVSTNGTLNVTAAGVLANDTDADGDVLRATLATTPTIGSVVLNADGSFRYIPTVGAVGSDTFTYRATDGINLSTPATVVITVGGANAAPVIVLPGSQLALRNTDLLIPSGLSISDGDAGINPVTATLTATNGTLTLGGVSGLTFTIGDGTADATMTFTGAIAAINTALTNLKFTPTNAYVGAAQIGLVVNDGGFTGTGGAQTGSGTVSINVSSGAALVANLSPGATSSSPTNLSAVGNLLYFAANDSITGSELWQSDGTSTATATTRVADINPTGSSSTPGNFTVVGNTVYFTATNSSTGKELWKTDLAGTSATLVNDLRLGVATSNPSSLVNFNNTLFFQANDGTGIAIFKIDSSGNPVKLVASPSYTVPANLTVVGNTLYFTANNATQLWKTDGTDGNTVLVRDLGSSPSAQIQQLTAVGNTLFFTAIDSTGRELWRSDGTAVNTTRVADLNPSSASSTPNNLVNVNGTLYFFARDAAAFKLWQSNAAGTVTLVSTLPSAGQLPSNLVAIGSKLFFTVDAGIPGSPDLQLWSSDGVSTATVVRNINAAGNDTVASLTNFNGSLYFTANDGTDNKVFRSDGTSAGTVAVSGNFSSTPTGLTVVNGKLFFAASDATNGTELWAVQ